MPSRSDFSSSPSRPSSLRSSSPPPSPSNDETVTARYRRLDLLEKEIGKKRKRNEYAFNLLQQQTTDLVNDSPTGPASVTSLGRGFRKIVDLWSDAFILIGLADQHKHEMRTEEDIDPEIDENDKEEKELRRLAKLERLHAYQAVKIFSTFVPNFAEAINNPKPEEVKHFLAQIQHSGNDARGDDIHEMKAGAADWINRWNPPPDVQLDPNDRAGRGLQHDLCGRLLSSIEHNWDDAEVRAKIRNFEPGFGLGPLARALYAGYTGSTARVEAGYLRSMMLVKAYQYIFTSPASARTVNDVASTLKVNNQVTPRAIAYAAIQLLFALSSAPHWTDEHEGLDFRNVYYHIVDFFENVEDDPESKKMAQDLLKWWNRQIFPEAQLSRANTAGATARKLLEEQRAARRARAALSDHN
ncbi:hypothetical protein H1R20_g11201, partial [Candolleomyces eurysporus]